MDVETIFLGLLADRDRTGHEITQHLRKVFSHFFVTEFSSIDPALADLTQQGLICRTTKAQARRPAEAVYGITPVGRATLIEALMIPPRRDEVTSEFCALMSFAHLLPPARIDEIAEDVIEQWDDTLSSIERCMSDEFDAVSPGMRFAFGYGKAVTNAARHYLAENRTGLIDEVRAEAASNGAIDAAGKSRHSK